MDNSYSFGTKASEVAAPSPSPFLKFSMDFGALGRGLSALASGLPLPNEPGFKISVVSEPPPEFPGDRLSADVMAGDDVDRILWVPTTTPDADPHQRVLGAPINMVLSTFNSLPNDCSSLVFCRDNGPALEMVMDRVEGSSGKIMCVDAVELPEELIDRGLIGPVFVSHHSGPYQDCLAAYPNGYDAEETFDLMVSHQNTHTYFGSPEKEQKLKGFVDAHLADDGYFIFDKFDFDSLGSWHNYSQCPSSGIQFLGRSPPSPGHSEGENVWRLDDRIYTTGVVSDETVYRVFDGYTVQILQGTTMVGSQVMGGGIAHPPRGYSELCRSSGMKVVSVVVVTKSSLVPTFQPIARPSPWGLIPHDPNVANLFSFRIPSTTPLTVVDIPLLGGRYLYTGVNGGDVCRIAVGEGNAVAQNSRTGALARALGKTRTGLPTLYLEGRWHEYNGHVVIRALELLDSGTGTPSTCINRLWHLERHIRLCPWIAEAITIRNWDLSPYVILRNTGYDRMVIAGRDSVLSLHFNEASNRRHVRLSNYALTSLEPAATEDELGGVCRFTGSGVPELFDCDHTILTRKDVQGFFDMDRAYSQEIEFLRASAANSKVSVSLGMMSVLRYPTSPIPPEWHAARSAFLAWCRGFSGSRGAFPRPSGMRHRKVLDFTGGPRPPAVTSVLV